MRGPLQELTGAPQTGVELPGSAGRLSAGAPWHDDERSRAPLSGHQDHNMLQLRSTPVRTMHSLTTAALRAAICILMLGTRTAQASVPSAAQDSLVAASLSMHVSQGEFAGLRWSNLDDVRSDLQKSYAARAWAPRWSRDGAARPQALQLVHALGRVHERGLEPGDYDLARLVRLAAGPLTSVAARTEFDLMLSVATLRVLRALTFGRVMPQEAHPTLHIARDSVAMDQLLDLLASGTSPDSVFDAAEPAIAPYQQLKRALAVFRARHATDDTLAQARVSQITITLERWRWLPRTSALAPAVVVNIPAFTLQVLSDDGTPSPLAMDVVVGNSEHHQTPIFADTIRSIEFAPYWIVPLSIAKAELIPVALRDPHALAVNNYEIVSQSGQVLVPSVNTARRVLAGTAFIRQLPGGTNSLGRVKFLFPNIHAVYLHDTPVQAGFALAQRDQSHGCIRIADPEAFAGWLLRDEPEWTAARIDSLMNHRMPTRVTLARGVPVYLFYATAVANAEGGIEFHQDIYGHDATLAALLLRGLPYRSVVADAGAQGR